MTNQLRQYQERIDDLKEGVAKRDAERTRLQAIVDKQNEWLRYLPDHILERATEDVAALKEQQQ